MESRYYEALENKNVRCIICPRMCYIKSEERGFCKTKENVDGRLTSLTYGKLSAVAVDPIEKKPLAHFYPGSLALSISSVGCSFTCPWCQNWHLSKSNPESLPNRFVSPEEVIRMAKQQNCTSISYTYNEPLINLDYVEDVSKIASENNVKNTLVTNGYISIPALKRVVNLIDAANVDWKSFNESFYKKYCSADLNSVLDATIEMKKNDVHVEITFLIIPKTNDDKNEIRDMASFLVNNLGPETPLHLSRFFPHHMFNHLPSTPLNTLIEARDIAKKEGVRYVFVGNIPYSEYDNTYCHRCDKPVIERVGYTITKWNLDGENYCGYCGELIPIIGSRVINKSMF